MLLKAEWTLWVIITNFGFIFWENAVRCESHGILLLTANCLSPSFPTESNKIALNVFRIITFWAVFALIRKLEGRILPKCFVQPTFITNFAVQIAEIMYIISISISSILSLRLIKPGAGEAWCWCVSMYAYLYSLSCSGRMRKAIALMQWGANTKNNWENSRYRILIKL